jgi:hypothetical protein
MWWIWAVDAEVPWPNVETNVTYNGRTFNLLPQSDEHFASIAVDAPMTESAEVSKAVHRFLSVLSWIDGKGIRTLWSVGNPSWRQPTPRSPYLAQPGKQIRIRSNFDFLPIPKDERAAKALAFFREAVSSGSPDNEFLQYFRIVELAHGHKNAEHPKFMNALLEVAKLKGDALAAIQALRDSHLDVGQQLVVYGRHAVAHGDDAIAIDPDITEERKLLQTIMPVMAGLAIYTIEEHFSVPTQRTYYQRHEYEIEGLIAKLSAPAREGILGSVGQPPLVAESPIKRITIGLRDSRFSALTDLIVQQAIQRDGGLTFVARSENGIVRVLVHFDLVERRLLFDPERGAQVIDNGSAASPDSAADVLELILGLVHNGELHVWDAEADHLLGRQNPNIPINIDGRETGRLLTARIADLRAQAKSRRPAADL